MWKLLYEPANAIDANLLLHVLEVDGFTVRVDGTFLQGAIGELPAGGGLRIMVSEEQYERARLVVEQWDRPVGASDTEVKKRSGFAGIFSGLVVGMLISAVLCYGYYRSPVSEGGVDYNNDGRMDAHFEYANGLPSATRFDRDLDGKSDLFIKYDQRGLMESAIADDDFDGKVETKISYRNDNVDSSGSDIDSDGFEEVVWKYKDGIAVSLSYIDKYSGYAHMKVDFVRNKMDSISYDRNHDGVIDQVLKFSPSGDLDLPAK